MKHTTIHLAKRLSFNTIVFWVSELLHRYSEEKYLNQHCLFKM